MVPSRRTPLSGLLAVLLFTLASAKECIVLHTEGLDDSSNILAAFKECAQDSVITFQQTNYSAYTPVTLSELKNVTVRLEGNLLLPNNVTEVQEKINMTSNQPSTYATPWFYIHGEDVRIIGSNQSGWGAFHGFGQQWWDTRNQQLRPQLATFNVTNGLLSGLKVIQPIAWGFNIPGTNVRVENHYVHAMPTNATRQDTTSFPFNTDGFNLSGQNITIDGYTGWNGDDCVSVVNGARDIVAQNGFCSFSSHGLSIGSLGKNGAASTVANVLFKNWTMEGAVYGARFKSWTGGNGWAENITWQDITVKNVSTAIYITQNYYDQEIGKPENPGGNSTKISNFRFENFSGFLNGNWTDGTCISNPCWNYVQGIDGTQSVIMDLYPDTALNLSFVNIDVDPPSQAGIEDASVLCDPQSLEPGEQDTLGFNCTDGPFEATEIKGGNSAQPSGATAFSAPVLLVTIVAVIASAFVP